MLQALLCGKMSSEQENSEDLLTSGVFGLLRHLPPSEGLFQILNLAERDDGVLDPCVPSLCEQVTKMEFWPTYSHEISGATEPDVMVWVRDANGRMHIFLIEVKLWSPKSSHPSANPKGLGDQLAREWWTLVSLCEREGAIPHLVYVTADRRRPLIEIHEAQEEYLRKLPAWGLKHPFVCYWLPWSKVVVSFEHSSVVALQEITLACRKLDLDPFAGVRPFALPRLGWSFSEGAEAYSLTLSPCPQEWRFE
jgi:hypothetical protein